MLWVVESGWSGKRPGGELRVGKESAENFSGGSSCEGASAGWTRVTRRPYRVGERQLRGQEAGGAGDPQGAEAEPSGSRAARVGRHKQRGLPSGAAAERKAKALKAQHNFKHSDASDVDSVYCRGQNHGDPFLRCPAHWRLLESILVYLGFCPAGLSEGTLIGHRQDIQAMFHLCLLVDTGFQVESFPGCGRCALAWALLPTGYTTFIKPSFEEFCLSTRSLLLRESLQGLTVSLT